MDNLDRDIREAQRLGYGVHYGRNKADHPHTKPVPIDGQLSGVFYTCSYCGEQFKPNAKTNKYCNVECYRAALKNKPAVLDIEL